jgi:hypothetical protein
MSGAQGESYGFPSNKETAAVSSTVEAATTTPIPTGSTATAALTVSYSAIEPKLSSLIGLAYNTSAHPVVELSTSTVVPNMTYNPAAATSISTSIPTGSASRLAHSIAGSLTIAGLIFMCF